MTSQQLRTYIGRVLGKSLRLILPSLWWRKLFEAVADRVDEVEGLIATSFKEYEKEHPSISSRTLYWTEDPESEEAKHNKSLVCQTYLALVLAVDGGRKVEQILYLATPSISVEVPHLYEITSPAWTLIQTGTAPGFVFFDVKLPPGTDKVNITFSGETGIVTVEEVESSSITIDSALSDTSTNAVQNKAIKSYVDTSASNVKTYTDTALSKKVDKVTGKQLSTEDFTSALKTKLEGLNNYDDTEINNALSKLQTQLDTLVSGDASTAIESFNEIIAFLSGITDSEGLDAIVASIEQQIANKVDKVEGKGLSTEDYTTKDKTKLEGIEEGAQKNVQSDWNEGDETSSAFIKNKPVIEVDSSMSDTSERAVQNKVIKSYVDGEVEVLTEAILENEEVTSKGLNSLNQKIIQVINEREINYATKAELSSEIEVINNEILDNEEVTSIALNYLNQRIDKLKNSLIIEYVKEVTLRAEIEAIMAIIRSNEQVISSSLNDLNERIEFTNNRFVNYATNSRVDQEVEAIVNYILDNEVVVSSSLNDLNERIEQLNTLVKSSLATA